MWPTWPRTPLPARSHRHLPHQYDPPQNLPNPLNSPQNMPFHMTRELSQRCGMCPGHPVPIPLLLLSKVREVSLGRSLPPWGVSPVMSPHCHPVLKVVAWSMGYNHLGLDHVVVTQVTGHPLSLSLSPSLSCPCPHRCPGPIPDPLPQPSVIPVGSCMSPSLSCPPTVPVPVPITVAIPVPAPAGVLSPPLSL